MAFSPLHSTPLQATNEREPFLPCVSMFELHARSSGSAAPGRRRAITKKVEMGRRMQPRNFGAAAVVGFGVIFPSSSSSVPSLFPSFAVSLSHLSLSLLRRRFVGKGRKRRRKNAACFARFNERTKCARRRFDVWPSSSVAVAVAASVNSRNFSNVIRDLFA